MDSLSLLPSQPGVYWFLDKKNKVLYVGKAKNLKKRVKAYLRLKQLTPRKRKLVKQASKVKHQVLTSELDALLIEAELIRLHQPQFNVLLKDDKSPVYLQITTDKFPQVNTIRKKELNKLKKPGTVLGPFTSAYQLKQVLKIARKIFPWCDQAGANKRKSSSSKQTKSKACFYYHLDQCPGACIGQIDPQDYQQNIDQLITFLKGKTKKVAEQLTNKMKALADELEFEQATKIKNKIKLIETVTSPKYRLKPDLILPALQDSKIKNSLLHLQRILQEYLPIPSNYQLKRIEGYDVSNIQGKAAAVSMVVFDQGKPDKSHYRLFNIRSIDTPNDYQMMKEAIARRQNHPEWDKPNLAVIDGGKGQLRAALSVWQWPNPVISLAKKPDRIILATKHYRHAQTNRLKIEYKVIKLPAKHPTLQLVQAVRDESHRFAKKQHARLRRRKMLML